MERVCESAQVIQALKCVVDALVNITALRNAADSHQLRLLLELCAVLSSFTLDIGSERHVFRHADLWIFLVMTQSYMVQTIANSGAFS